MNFSDNEYNSLKMIFDYAMDHRLRSLFILRHADRDPQDYTNNSKLTKEGLQQCMNFGKDIPGDFGFFMTSGIERTNKTALEMIENRTTPLKANTDNTGKKINWNKKIIYKPKYSPYEFLNKDYFVNDKEKYKQITDVQKTSSNLVYEYSFMDKDDNDVFKDKKKTCEYIKDQLFEVSKLYMLSFAITHDNIILPMLSHFTNLKMYKNDKLPNLSGLVFVQNPSNINEYIAYPVMKV